MIINKSYKFRLYPNKQSQEQIKTYIEYNRIIYNFFLEKRIKGGVKYSTNKMLHDIGTLKREHKEILNNLDDAIISTAISNLEKALNLYYKGVAEFPKIKKSNSIRTYTTKSYRYKNENLKIDIDNKLEVDWKNKYIKLPCLPKMQIKGYRNLTHVNVIKISSATVSYIADKYYVSVAVLEENGIEPIKKIRTAVGIDLGVKTLATTSDYITYQHMNKLQKYEKKIKGLNKSLSRSKKGGKNRKKIANKIGRVYKQLSNGRDKYIHEVTNEIVDNNDLIIIENLDIQGMIEKIKEKPFTKKILDNSLRKFTEELEYKCRWKGKVLIKVDRYFKSSQMCNHCGYMNKNTKNLDIRKWECQKCHNENDRDLNASINLLYEGVCKYYKKVLN